MHLLSSNLQQSAGKFPNSYFWCRTLNGFGKHWPSQVPPARTSFPPTTGDKMVLVKMRDFEPPSLRHNQMATYFETLCVRIAGPALLFLHTHTNLSPFTKDFRGEGQLDQYISNFSQVLLKRDWPERIEKSLKKQHNILLTVKLVWMTTTSHPGAMHRDG